MKEKTRVLILAPHTDDGELGCGASIARFIEEGCEVYYAAFSACEQSVLKEFPSDILITEVKHATRTLGIDPNHLILFRYEVRTFNFRRQEILDDLIRLNKDIKPNIIFLPSQDDIHQDHQTIYNEGLRAYKFCSIYSYELPWNNFNFTPNYFITLSPAQMETKMLALKEYKSQAHRPYFNEEFIFSLARIRGVQCGKQYAESFCNVRSIL